MTTRKIGVGDKVRIRDDNPPDEWGIVVAIRRADRYSRRRAVVRQIDGTTRVWGMDRLSILEEFEDLPDSERMCHVPECLNERYPNWTTCEKHEDRGARVFDL